MTAYILIIIFLFFLRYVVYNKPILIANAKRNFIILSLLPVTVVAGLRSEEIGADTNDYSQLFESIAKTSNLLNVNKRLEPGFIYLNKFISFFTSEVQWLFILVSIFLSVCIGIFVYKNAKDPFLAILFFITLGLFQFSLSGMRQTIAIGITILSMELIKNRKFLLFLIMIFIAFTFHKSSVLFLPAYFVANNKINYKLLIGYMILFIAIILSVKPILLGTAYLLDYNYGIEKSSTGQIFFSIVLLISIFGFWLREKIIRQNQYYPIFLNISFGSLFLWTIRLFSRTAERVTFYYMPSTYLVLEEIVSSIKNKNNKLIFYLLVSALSIALFIYRLSGDKNLVPYHFL